MFGNSHRAYKETLPLEVSADAFVFLASQLFRSVSQGVEGPTHGPDRRCGYPAHAQSNVSAWYSSLNILSIGPLSIFPF